MSDKNEVTTEPSPNALNNLKLIADDLGITYHPNIGIDKLQAKLDEAQSTPKAPVNTSPKREVKVPAYLHKTEGQLKAEMVKEATKLIRIRITCMNPNKKEWEGEIFTASNKFVPAQKKYVPFNVEDGWHVPQIIVNMIKERKCQIFKTVKVGNQKVRKGYLVPEFSVEILDPLTKEELEALKVEQSMANRIG